MARMSLRGFLDVYEYKTYARFNVSSEYIFKEIIIELRKNNIDCTASIERASYRFKNVESDGLVLFLSERGLFTQYVSICSLGNYSQVQIVTRNVARKYSLNDANHSMEFSMHNLYRDTVNKCINDTIERIAAKENWKYYGNETSEVEAQ